MFPSPKDHPYLYGIILFFIFVFFLWLSQGGPSRTGSGPFIKPFAPLDSGDTYTEPIFPNR